MMDLRRIHRPVQDLTPPPKYWDVSEAMVEVPATFTRYDDINNPTIEALIDTYTVNSQVAYSDGDHAITASVEYGQDSSSFSSMSATLVGDALPTSGKWYVIATTEKTFHDPGSEYHLGGVMGFSMGIVHAADMMPGLSVMYFVRDNTQMVLGDGNPENAAEIPMGEYFLILWDFDTSQITILAGDKEFIIPLPPLPPGGYLAMLSMMEVISTDYTFTAAEQASFTVTARLGEPSDLPGHITVPEGFRPLSTQRTLPPDNVVEGTPYIVQGQGVLQGNALYENDIVTFSSLDPMVINVTYTQDRLRETIGEMSGVSNPVDIMLRSGRIAGYAENFNEVSGGITGCPDVQAYSFGTPLPVRGDAYIVGTETTSGPTAYFPRLSLAVFSHVEAGQCVYVNYLPESGRYFTYGAAANFAMSSADDNPLPDASVRMQFYQGTFPKLGTAFYHAPSSTGWRTELTMQGAYKKRLISGPIDVALEQGLNTHFDLQYHGEVIETTGDFAYSTLRYDRENSYGFYLTSINPFRITYQASGKYGTYEGEYSDTVHISGPVQNRFGVSNQNVSDNGHHADDLTFVPAPARLFFGNRSYGPTIDIDTVENYRHHITASGSSDVTVRAVYNEDVDITVQSSAVLENITVLLGPVSPWSPAPMPPRNIVVNNLASTAKTLVLTPYDALPISITVNGQSTKAIRIARWPYVEELN